MTTKNLSTVAADVIEAYGITATNLINATRFGGERLFGFVGARATTAMTTGSERAHGAIGMAVDLATKGIGLLASNAERFDRAAKLGALDTLNRVAMPAAQAVSLVAERLEEGSSELVKRVAGKAVPAKAIATRTLASRTRKAAVARKQVTKAVTKRAEKVTQTATRRASKAVAKTATQTSNAARRVARKAKATAAAA